MREALTVIGFLLIVAFAAVFTAPLYVDWNAWREDIGNRLTQHFGTTVIIRGPIEARLLPQPWLSLSDVSIGDPYGTTRLNVARIDGDVSLGGLLRGDVDLSNVVVRDPALSVAADDEGTIAPLSKYPVSLGAAVESFEVSGGSLHYVNKVDGQDISLTGINLVGESGSVLGPYKAEGGIKIAGVPHTIKIATGVAEKGSLNLRITAVPADKPVTLDLDGQVKLQGGKPTFVGMATLLRPTFSAKAAGEGGPDDQAAGEQLAWSMSGPVTATPAGVASDKVSIQLGPDERALKLAGSVNLAFGATPVLEANLAGKQLELDRFAGIGPDKRQPPAAVLARLARTVPTLAGAATNAQIDLAADGLMLGGELIQNARASLRVAEGKLQVDRLEATLPGKSHLLLAGDVNDEGGGFKGNLDLKSGQATGLIGWLQGQPVLGRPDAARKLSLKAALDADADKVDFSQLTLAIDDAAVKGRLAWNRLAHGRSAGRVEANLAAQRIDLDVLPSVAALLPGSSDLFSEADIRLQAEALALSGIEAKSVSGHIKAGGKLIALEDVVVNDLGGANLTANGRIDNIGAEPQGEIRIVLNGKDLSGLATTLKRSTLPVFWVNAFAARAASLSPANASLSVAFGAARRYSVDGKFGGSVLQLDTQFAGKGAGENADIRVKADSLDVATLMRQAGLDYAVGSVPGRASLEMALSGPLNGAMRWNASFEGAGLQLSGTGKMTGSFEAPAFDGRLTASTDDALVPAQLLSLPLPGVVPSQSATLDSGFRARAGRYVFDDLTGTVLGMPLSGALTINAGKPTRLDGRLNFLKADGQLLGSLFSGADLSAGNTNGNAFSDESFGAGTFDAFAGRLSVSAKTLRLSRRLPELDNARAVLNFGNGKVAVDDFAAKLAGGDVSGALQLSHAALDTAASGHFSLHKVALQGRQLSGELAMGVEFQGNGRSPDALMSSLTGGGTAELAQASLAGLSEKAFGQTVVAVDGGLSGDAGHVREAFERSLDEAPLKTGTINGNLSLAGGVLRLSSTRATSAQGSIALSGLLDLSDLTVKADIALSPTNPADGFGGPAPIIPVQLRGTIDALQKQVDVSSLVAWLSIRGVEQQARKLEVLEAQRRIEEKAQEDARRAEALKMQKAIEDARRKAQLQVPAPTSPPLQLRPGAPVPATGGAGVPLAPTAGLPGVPPVKLPSLENLPASSVTPGHTTVVPAPLLPNSGPALPQAPIGSPPIGP
ncbi:AsmA family protein [Labrys neptuniae]